MPDEHSNLEKEIRTAEAMIEIFCHGHLGTKEGLCPECRELLGYVAGRLQRHPAYFSLTNETSKFTLPPCIYPPSDQP